MNETEEPMMLKIKPTVQFTDHVMWKQYQPNPNLLESYQSRHQQNDLTIQTGKESQSVTRETESTLRKHRTRFLYDQEEDSNNKECRSSSLKRAEAENKSFTYYLQEHSSSPEKE